MAPVDDVAVAKPAPSAWTQLVLAGRAAAGAGAPRPLASVVAVTTAPAPLDKAVFARPAPSARPSLAAVLGARRPATAARRRSALIAEHQTVDTPAPLRIGVVFAVGL